MHLAAYLNLLIEYLTLFNDLCRSFAYFLPQPPERERVTLCVLSARPAQECNFY